MRIPILIAAIVIPSFCAFAAEPPPLPKEITVEGASCKGAEHLKPRAPERPADLSGLYDSESITDGLQTLKLRVHADAASGWLVDGTLSTTYGRNPPELVTFKNASLRIEGGAAWFENGIPAFTGHFVSFKPPQLAPNDPVFAWRPALVMHGSVYSREIDRAKRPGELNARNSEAKK
jgi:hypothetical protein